MSLWSLCIDPVPTEMKKGHISRSTTPCSPLKRKTPGSLCHRRLGKERRDRSSHWRMIKGKQRLHVGVGRVEGHPHREREGHPKELHSSAQEPYCAVSLPRMSQAFLREISHHLPHLLIASCGCDPALMDEKRDLVGAWGWPSLFGKSWVVRKTYRYIHWDLKAFLCLMAKYSWQDKTEYSLQSD